MENIENKLFVGSKYRLWASHGEHSYEGEVIDVLNGWVEAEDEARGSEETARTAHETGVDPGGRLPAEPKAHEVPQDGRRSPRRSRRNPGDLTVDATAKQEVLHTQISASVLLGISLLSLERLVRAGKIKTVRVGQGWRVPASEIARINSSTPAAPPASTPVDTPTWLREHLPAAEPWWRLWQADLAALKLASQIAKTLPETRSDNLLLAHGDAERTSSLGYLAELYAAISHAGRALEAHDAGADRVLALVARRERLSWLLNEALRETKP